jgi:hypothetical protein
MTVWLGVPSACAQPDGTEPTRQRQGSGPRGRGAGFEQHRVRRSGKLGDLRPGHDRDAVIAVEARGG